LRVSYRNKLIFTDTLLHCKHYSTSCCCIYIRLQCWRLIYVCLCICGNV